MATLEQAVPTTAGHGRAAIDRAALPAASATTVETGSRRMSAKWPKAGTAASPPNHAPTTTGSEQAGGAISTSAWLRPRNRGCRCRSLTRNGGLLRRSPARCPRVTPPKRRGDGARRRGVAHVRSRWLLRRSLCCRHRQKVTATARSRAPAWSTWRPWFKPASFVGKSLPGNGGCPACPQTGPGADPPGGPANQRWREQGLCRLGTPDRLSAAFRPLQADFGKTIRGFFYDTNPRLRAIGHGTQPGSWAEVGGLEEGLRGLQVRAGGEEQVAARTSISTPLPKRDERCMGAISAWCRARGVLSIGHFMEHGNLYQHLQFSGGDMMRSRLQRHGASTPCLTSLSRQRDVRDGPCWQTPKLKLGDPCLRQAGRRDHGRDLRRARPGPHLPGDEVVDRPYACVGRQFPHPALIQSAGSVGHRFVLSYNGGFEPRWPLYRLFADYSSRLSLMLSGGRHVRPVANTAFGASAARQPCPSAQISESLQTPLRLRSASV